MQEALLKSGMLSIRKKLSTVIDVYNPLRTVYKYLNSISPGILQMTLQKCNSNMRFMVHISNAMYQNYFFNI
jgi:hypothetical protein